jgi:hypothetical protein
MGQVWRHNVSRLSWTECMQRWKRPDAYCAVHVFPPQPARSATYPATSRVISRTKAVRLDRKPFLLEILGAGVLGVTSVYSVSTRSLLVQICVVCCSRVTWRGSWDGGGANVLWPALRPTMRPDFCLTSFGILAVVVLSMEMGSLKSQVATALSLRLCGLADVTFALRQTCASGVCTCPIVGKSSVAVLPANILSSRCA